MWLIITMLTIIPVGDADMTKRDPADRQCTQDFECGKGDCWVGECFSGGCIGWWTCV
jgi:hypothetical protein